MKTETKIFLGILAGILLIAGYKIFSTPSVMVAGASTSVIDKKSQAQKLVNDLNESVRADKGNMTNTMQGVLKTSEALAPLGFYLGSHKTQSLTFFLIPLSEMKNNKTKANSLIPQLKVVYAELTKGGLPPNLVRQKDAQINAIALTLEETGFYQNGMTLAEAAKFELGRN